MNIYDAQTKDEVQVVKNELKKKYGSRYEQLNSLLFSIDPIDVNYGNNTGEYESEVCALLPELYPNISEESVTNVLIPIFVHFFGEDQLDELMPKLREIANCVHEMYQEK